eukprot:gene11403-23856_t
MINTKSNKNSGQAKSNQTKQLAIKVKPVNSKSNLANNEKKVVLAPSTMSAAAKSAAFSHSKSESVAATKSHLNSNNVSKSVRALNTVGSKSGEHSNGTPPTLSPSSSRSKVAPAPGKLKKTGSELELESRNPFLRYYKSFFDNEIVHLRDPNAIEAARNLNLTQHHLRTLKRRYREIDIECNQAIDIKDFLDSINMPASPMTKALFDMIDIDQSSTMEFEEYVRILATYCMYTKDEILKFCFNTFDLDGSGTISEKEFVELCVHVNNGAPTFPGNYHRALEEFDVNKDGTIDYSEFCEMERRYPMILFPAFQLQDAMQQQSLGEREWVKLIERYRRHNFIDEYRHTHGGADPPATMQERLGRYFCCFQDYQSHSAIKGKLGAALEAKHRSSVSGPSTGKNNHNNHNTTIQRSK